MLSHGYWGSRRRSCDSTVERGASVVMCRGDRRECVNNENFRSGGQTTNWHDAGIRAGKGMCNPHIADRL
jgi:hypothetical protein